MYGSAWNKSNLEGLQVKSQEAKDMKQVAMGREK